MRLTLRTLLAYMDDTLDAQTAREIGQKIEESDFAQDLIERIRRVVRRRRLSAPRPLSQTVDANVVAEYLDNVLERELVADVETMCLRSDRELAEVAACHQILTMIGQPAEVNAEVRQRLLQAVLQRLHLEQPPSEAEAPQRPVLLDELRGARWKVALVALGVVVLAALLLVGTWRLRQRGGSDAVVSSRGSAARPSESQGPPSAGPDTTSPDTPSKPRQAPASRRPPQPATPSQAGSGSGSQQGAAKRAADTGPADARAAQPQPQTTPAASKKKAAAAAGSTPRPPASAADAGPRRALGLFAASTHVGALYDAGVGDWVVVGRETPLNNGTPLVNFDGVRSRVVVDRWVVDLVNQTGCIWTRPQGPQAPLVLELQFGQVVLRAQRVPAELLITTSSGAAFAIHVKDTGTQIAVRSEPKYRPGGPHDATTSFALLSGKASIALLLPQPKAPESAQPPKAEQRPAGAQEEPADAADRQPPRWGYVVRETVDLEPGQDLLFSVAKGTFSLQSRLGAPDWINGRALPLSQRRTLTQFLKALPQQGRITPALLELLHEREASEPLRALALKSLVALGRLDPVVQTLGNAESMFLRLEAARWLRWYLALGLAEYAHLAESVYRVYVGKTPPPPQEESKATSLLEQMEASRADAIVLLLNGIPEEAARSRELYEALIALLRPEIDLAVRQLAISTLRDLTGEDHGYNPELPTARSIQAWLRDLERGTLPPRRLRRKR